LGPGERNELDCLHLETSGDFPHSLAAAPTGGRFLVGMRSGVVLEFELK